MKINKSPGVTSTERLLAGLCERSFLKLWSYPNPFKDDGKELCDLLAIFENHLFVFFDRENRNLDDDGKDPLVQWERWKRKTIDAQLQTASGAERYLKSGRKIYLDDRQHNLLPLSYDPAQSIIHKIVVAHGAKEACLRASGSNVYGSLAISYGPNDVGPEHPFFVRLNKNDPAHVFDSHNLEVILQELDTFFDFATYLDAKLAAIKQYDGLMYCGEEDLIAHYYLNYDEKTKRHFIGVDRQDITGIFIAEGEWKDFSESKIYKTRKDLDSVSYLWDGIIQRTCDNALNGTLMGDDGVFVGKSAIHEMAKEPRFMRRELSKRMISAVRNFPDAAGSMMRNLTFMPSFYEGKGYVFLQLKVDKIGDYETEYRPVRQAFLEIACGAAKNKFPDLQTVVGIAIDAPKYSSINSEDFLLMDCREWPEERKARYAEANKELRCFATSKMVEQIETVVEFPEPSIDTQDG